MIKIRKAKLEDLPECSRLLNKFKELANPSGEHNHKWWLKELIRKQVFLVAENDGKIVGLAIGELATGGLALLHLICVDRKFQNQGIGKLLFLERENMLKKRGARAIMSYAHAKSKKIISILKNNKYEQGALTYEFIKFI